MSNSAPTQKEFGVSTAASKHDSLYTIILFYYYTYNHLLCLHLYCRDLQIVFINNYHIDACQQDYRTSTYGYLPPSDTTLFNKYDVK